MGLTRVSGGGCRYLARTSRLPTARELATVALALYSRPSAPSTSALARLRPSPYTLPRGCVVYGGERPLLACVDAKTTREPVY
ncbi:hypothetical protein EV715DRAFT_298177 [Schizophyllum commune]